MCKRHGRSRDRHGWPSTGGGRPRCVACGGGAAQRGDALPVGQSALCGMARRRVRRDYRVLDNRRHGAQCLEGMRPHVEAALAGKPMQRDAEVVHKRLGHRWIHVECVPTFGPSGAPDGWIEVITDVTEQRGVEQSLRENRRTLQSFYDSSPFFMGLVELDGDSIIFLSANQALARALGTTPERMTNSRADEFGTPDELRLWLQSYQTSGRDGAPVRFDYAHPTLSGDRWYRATVAFLERWEATIQLRRRGDHRAEEGGGSAAGSQSPKDEFLAMLGHELRNPLAPIVTALAADEAAAAMGSARESASLERQVQHMIRLVDDLLDVSRITRGTIRAKRKRLLEPARRRGPGGRDGEPAPGAAAPPLDVDSRAGLRQRRRRAPGAGRLQPADQRRASTPIQAVASPSRRIARAARPC